MTAPFKVGDELLVLHTCRGLVSLAHDIPIDHTASLTIEAVVALNTGNTWRVEATRCDGSGLHVVVKHAGRAVDVGGALGAAAPIDSPPASSLVRGRAATPKQVRAGEGSALTPARTSPPAPLPGRCRGCGCTDDHACAGGCGWADQDLSGAHGGPLCTRCARERRLGVDHPYPEARPA